MHYRETHSLTFSKSSAIVAVSERVIESNQQTVLYGVDVNFCVPKGVATFQIQFKLARAYCINSTCRSNCFTSHAN